MELTNAGVLAQHLVDDLPQCTHGLDVYDGRILVYDNGRERLQSSVSEWALDLDAKVARRTYHWTEPGWYEFIIAADHATFFDPHLSFGMAAVLEPTLMAHRMPFGEIMRMSLLGNTERVSADRAREIGLVSEVVGGEALLAHAQEVAADIAAAPTEAAQATVRNLWMAAEPGRRTALEMSSFLLHAGNNAANMQAGQAVFTTKQKRRHRMR